MLSRMTTRIEIYQYFGAERTKALQLERAKLVPRTERSRVVNSVSKEEENIRL